MRQNKKRTGYTLCQYVPIESWGNGELFLAKELYKSIKLGSFITKFF